jgi:hypothetical protein
MRQPKAIAHGIQQSKSLAIAQNAVPLVPLADEFENQWHGASLSPALRPYKYSKGNAPAKVTKS